MTDRNREVTLKFIEAMGSNDAQGAAECLAPDGMAVTKGFSKASGTRKAGTVVEAIESFKALMPTGLRLEVLTVTAEAYGVGNEEFEDDLPVESGTMVPSTARTL